MSIKNINSKNRCWWCESDPVYIKYHDTEWGVPVHNDKKLFEMLILEGFQAGLSWITILKKRANFKKAFCNFDPKKVAKMTDRQLEKLMHDSGIIRNRLKIFSARINARCFLKVQKEFGSFDKYIWQFTNYKTLRSKKNLLPKKIPARTKESDAMSKDLKKRGFKFVGSTICYAHMQATGMVDDHVLGCFKYRKRGK
jgi:DNA-3-methyladenine glycosylase I